MDRARRNPLFPFLLAALLLFLFACAPKRPQAPEGPPAEAWQAFRTGYASNPHQSFTAKASLFLRTKDQGHRVVLDLWGNYPQPVRLDIRAGIGAALSHFREGDDGLLAYFPEAGKAYFHPDPVIGQQALGLPLPVTLPDLASLLAGDFSRVVPREYDQALPESDHVRYLFNQGPVGGMDLDFSGRPLRLVGPSGRSWELTLSDWEDGEPPYPSRMELTLPDGGLALLRIKSRQLTLAPERLERLDLDLPPGTPVLSLPSRPLAGDRAQ